MRIILSALFILFSSALIAQVSSEVRIPLDDLSSFRPQAGNWRIAGEVSMNPDVDIHVKPEPAAKKKRKNQPPPVNPVSYSEGKGILLNINDEQKKDHLVTTFEHGDIELELEVMLPKGSNSGIYLQGRYEVQLLDSWGVQNPTYGDIGGIYRNWETQPGKIYAGKPPLSNAAKAPGLWQTMKIAFRAPRFDAAGKKIANARFTSVDLNGVRIHDNVEVPLPTGGPLENNEVATGPLMIQGDHGPVAFRNIRYRLMHEADIKLSDIRYKAYYGNFRTSSDYVGEKPAAEGSLAQLTCEMLETENEYALVYTGQITVPEDASYSFTLVASGGGKLLINNQELASSQSGDGWMGRSANLALKAGSYPFEIHNFKNASWMPPRLGLFVSAANIYPVALHAFNSFPPDDHPTSPILVNPQGKPRILRAFLDFRGDRSQRLTHTVGVGNPAGLNYIYDLQNGNLVCVWRGDFVDATPMWHDRGDGSFKPLGAVQYFFSGQPLAAVDSDGAFPARSDEKSFRSKGYSINEKTGQPVFRYLSGTTEVEDAISADPENKFLTREITLKDSVGSGLKFKVAEGKTIVRVSDGVYAVDDRSFYIRIDPSFQPTVRNSGGKQELVVPANKKIIYSIVW